MIEVEVRDEDIIKVGYWYPCLYNPGRYSSPCVDDEVYFTDVDKRAWAHAFRVRSGAACSEENDLHTSINEL